MNHVARTQRDLEKFYDAIRDVPDFPKAGIVFRDITPLLAKASLFREAVDLMITPYRASNVEKVLGIESRGFILGAPAALDLGAGLVPARKSGKLPWERITVEYELEYGTDALEVHADGIMEGDRVLIVDDLLATGGTASAAVRAVTKAGGEIVGLTFLIELVSLNGRKKLEGTVVRSLLTYPRQA